jgi:esterase FrsA
MKQFGDLSYLGPDLSEGPLPALFYFALSAEESLQVDPFNQPAAVLSHLRLRIFSIDLPAHGPEFSAVQAIGVWAAEFTLGRDPITPFLHKVQHQIEALAVKGAFTEIAVMGLSRGAFIACHVAARLPEIRTILGFAPLTQLTFAKEFKEIKENPKAEALNASHLVDALANKTIRFYIGNLDKRVSTHRCFHFIETLCETAYHRKVRSPPIELILKPSIGHQGHGTSKEVFHEGAYWIADKLGVRITS